MKGRILLSNDDGIKAPGIKALYDQLKTCADVTAVAPATEKSAVGHAISIHHDLSLVEAVENGEVWGLGVDEGTPADCVKFAITHLMKEPPDLVISGINRGQNTGNSILYSGTVAAAVEGAMFGVPSFAVSLAALAPIEPYYDFAAGFAARLARLVLEKGLPRGVTLNVNVPNCPEDEIEGVVVSRQGESMFEDYFEEFEHHDGLLMYRNIGGKMFLSPPERAECDDVALNQNKVSITPLQFDLTCHPFRDELKKWFENGASR